MTICKLCQKKDATKKGSHIFPHSLIKTAINFNGEKARGKEFLFTFSSDASPKRYQGESVLPEKVEELEMPLEHINIEDHNPTTEDYIFCPECEAKFGEIESYYAEKIIIPFRQSSIFEDKDRMAKALKNVENKKIRLYTYGLFWRASISEIYDFKMDKKDEETLRKILTTPLGEENEMGELNNFPLATVLLAPMEDTTKAIIDAYKFSNRPYMLIIGDFVFILYMNKEQMKSPISNFYGLDKLIKSENIFNVQENEYLFAKLFEGERDEFLKNALDFSTDQNILAAVSKFIFIHKKILGVRPAPEDMENFVGDYKGLGVNVNDSMKLKLIQETVIKGFLRMVKLGQMSASKLGDLKALAEQIRTHM